MHPRLWLLPLLLFCLPALVLGQKDDIRKDLKDRPKVDGVKDKVDKDVKKEEPKKEDNTKASLSSEESTLKQAHLGTTATALLDFFEKRTKSVADADEVAGLIKKLGDKSAETREKAMGELIALGHAAVPQLRQAANTFDDPDVPARARECLSFIEGAGGATIASAAARQLALLRPDKTLDVLIEYLPFADDDQVSSEVHNALIAVAPRSGTLDPVLIKALEDKVPVRRAVAAEVLCQTAGRNAFSAVRPLLKDAKPTVKLRVALSLVNSYNPEGVPVLIDLLGDLPIEQRKQAEDYLKDLAGDWTVTVPQGNDGISRKLRKDMWGAWWKAIDGPTLIDEFKSRTISDEERTKVLELIAQLGDADRAKADKATTDLITLADKAAPLLRQTANSPDNKLAAAALKALQAIERDHPSPLPSIAPRLLGLRQPEGAAQVVLNYLPFAETEDAAIQLREILGIVGFKDGKPDPALLKGLEDKMPLKRGAAAAALCRMPGAHLAAVVKMLKDDDATVRMRAGLALAQIREKEAVPVLIDSLEKLPFNSAREIEEYLTRVAGEKGPTDYLANDMSNKTKVKDAWTAWWKANGDKVDLARVETTPPEMKYMLLVEGWGVKGGRVMELDATGKVRWQITQLQYPMAAQALPGDRVLVAEQNRHRIFESDTKGKIIWEKQLISAFCIQRMRNGNTWAAGRNNVVEYDRHGKELYNRNVGNGDQLMGARKFPDGTTAFVTWQGHYHRLNAEGKELKTFQVPWDLNFGINGAEVCANDHVIACVNATHKVTEYDGSGKVVWEAKVSNPTNVTRLNNGHTLVSAYSNTRIVELDRNGKQVAEYKDLPDNMRPWRAFRR